MAQNQKRGNFMDDVVRKILMEDESGTRAKRSTRNAAPLYRWATEEVFDAARAKAQQESSHAPRPEPKRRLLTPRRRDIIRKFIHDEHLTPGRYGLIGDQLWIEELAKQFVIPGGSNELIASVTVEDVDKWLQVTPFAEMVKAIRRSHMKMRVEQEGTSGRSTPQENSGGLSEGLVMSPPFLPDQDPTPGTSADTNGIEQVHDEQDQTATGSFVSAGARKFYAEDEQGSGSEEVSEDSVASRASTVKLEGGSTFQNPDGPNDTINQSDPTLKQEMIEMMEVDSDSEAATMSSSQDTIEAEHESGEGQSPQQAAVGEESPMDQDAADAATEDDCVNYVDIRKPDPLIALSDCIVNYMLVYNEVVQNGCNQENGIVRRVDQTLKQAVEAVKDLATAMRER